MGGLNNLGLTAWAEPKGAFKALYLRAQRKPTNGRELVNFPCRSLVCSTHPPSRARARSIRRLLQDSIMAKQTTAPTGTSGPAQELPRLLTGPEPGLQDWFHAPQNASLCRLASASVRLSAKFVVLFPVGGGKNIMGSPNFAKSGFSPILTVCGKISFKKSSHSFSPTPDTPATCH